MSTLKVNDIEEATSGGGKIFMARAWAQFDMSGTPSLDASGGVSSLTDLGTGSPQFNLSNALAAANGGAYLTHAVYSTGIEYPIQTGARITSTTAVKGFCGSDNTTRSDWQEGSFGVIRT
jgi:hypothetical protein